MKFQNIIILMIGVATVSVSTISCSDSYLEEKMYSNYSADVSDVEAQVLALHRKYGQMLGWSDQQGFVGCWQDGTDVGAPGDVQGVETPFYKYAELTSSNAGVSYLWKTMYDMINSANIIINGENGTDAQKAEAKFFRAYSYNVLVTLWGAVPLLTEATNSPNTAYTRNAVTEVDAVIESDLTDAMENLPDVESLVSQNRISKDAARILAGQAFLRMGMRDNSYFAKAESAVTPIISEGNYELISERYGDFTDEAGDYYHDMFRWGNQRRSQGNTEGIWTFQMEYERDVTGGTLNAPQQRRNWVCAFHKYSGMQNADSLGGRGNGRLRLTNYVKYKVFETGDIRNSNFNIRRTLWYNRPDYEETIGIDENGFRVDTTDASAVKTITVKTGDEVIPRDGDSLNVFYPHTTKWGAYDDTDDFGWAMVKDFPLMRFAEAYLLRAEARVQQGNTSGAAEDINVLRDRAFKTYRSETGDASAGSVTASQMDLDFILDERIRELVGEENRRMTLVRTGKLYERWLNCSDKGDKVPDSKLSTGFVQGQHELLPIPLTEIQLNKDATLEQNPGYTD